VALFDVLIIGLGGWRLASLLVREEGPGRIFERLRDWAGVPRGTGEIEGFFAGVLSCIWCASIFTTTGVWALWLVAPEVAALTAAWAVAMLVAIATDR
jgi:hypothetical protein